jgi:exonuclease III
VWNIGAGLISASPVIELTIAIQACHPDYGNSFAHNWGWRIDHILGTAPMADRCRAIEVDLETRRATGASDHAAVWAEFDLY